MSIFFTVLAIVTVAVGVAVLLSYAIAWYEYANRNPELMKNRFSAQQLWFATKLIGEEIFFLFLTTLLYPLGWFSPKEKVAKSSSDTPIIFLHGLFHNRACWFWTKYRLRRQGFRALYSLNLPFWRDVEILTERVARKVDELRHTMGIEKVHLVGHSMGGIVARNYLQIRGGAKKVDRCILLASPNGGSKLAPFTLTPPGKVLMPGSEFLLRLAAAPLPSEAHLTAIYSRHDNMVLPFENAQLEGVHNVELAGMGHASLLYRSKALQAIIDALKGEQQ
jgi:pimeloyl-ACP methyl ester carboxylesterase